MSALRAGLLINFAIHRFGLWLVWAILGGILVINVTLLLLIADRDGAGGGAMGSLLAYMAISAIIVAARGLPFAIAAGVTRRWYFGASAAGASAIALSWSALAAALAWVEDAVDGWGVGLSFFRLPGYREFGPLGEFGLLMLGLMAAFAVGWVFGVVHLRWGTGGVLVALFVLFAMAGVLVMLALASALPGAINWLFTAATPGRAAVGLVGVLGLFLITGYALTRRAAV